MGTDIQANGARACVVALAFLLLAPSGFVRKANAGSICYFELYSLEQREFKAGSSDAMTRLEDDLIRSYEDQSGVDNVPIASDGSIYVASTCEYMASVRSGLNGCIAMNEISEVDYSRQLELAAQSGRFIREEPGTKIPLSPRPCAGGQ